MTQSAAPRATGADRYSGWLDHSFDERLRLLELPWLPWVGVRFREQPVRTLVLGESVYDYSTGKTEQESTRQKILDSDHLRLLHLNHGILAKKKSPYVRNFERAFYLKRRPSPGERTDLWSSVAYHNLVLRMLRSSRSRPTDGDYVEGWMLFFKVSRSLGVQRVIVYGLEERKIRALRSLPFLRIQRLPFVHAGPSKPICLEVECDSGHRVRMLFIRHPSAYFSWQDWGRVVQQFVLSETAGLNAKV